MTNIDIWLACLLISTSVTLAMRALIAAPFMHLLDPPSRLPRASTTWTDHIKGKI